MAEFPELDDVDRSIVRALQLNGRASWKQIAKAIGSPESTVTRRGQQLLSNRTVAVTAVLDHLRCGLGVSIYIRFRARPGRVMELAEAIASMSAPRFVTITIGSFDVVAEVVVQSHRDILSVTGGLDQIEDVLETESMVVMRKFSAFEEWHPGWFDDDATRLLRKGGAVTHYAHRDWITPERLTPQEFRIAEILAADGRATYAAVAAEVGISESTAARRVESLVSRGCLRFRTLFEAPVIGLDVEFILWLAVDPSRIEAIGDAVSKHPATRYASATTGRFNLIIQGVLPGYGELYTFMTQMIGHLPGVLSADVSLLGRTLKRAWVPIDREGRPLPSVVTRFHDDHRSERATSLPAPAAIRPSSTGWVNAGRATPTDERL
jgi:DNA-binding Lrp family transcriptional regulator